MQDLTVYWCARMVPAIGACCSWIPHTLTPHLCFLTPPHLASPWSLVLSLIPRRQAFQWCYYRAPCVNSEYINLFCTNRADTPTPLVALAKKPSHPPSSTVGGHFRTLTLLNPVMVSWDSQKARFLFSSQSMPVVLVTIIAYWFWSLNLKTCISFY